jgi:hypothetical protein
VDLHKLIACLRKILSDSHPLQFLIAGHGDALPDPDLKVSLRYFEAVQRAATTTLVADNDFSSFAQVKEFPEVHSRNLEIARKSVETR